MAISLNYTLRAERVLIISFCFIWALESISTNVQICWTEWIPQQIDYWNGAAAVIKTCSGARWARACQPAHTLIASKRIDVGINCVSSHIWPPWASQEESQHRTDFNIMSAGTVTVAVNVQSYFYGCSMRPWPLTKDIIENDVARMSLHAAQDSYRLLMGAYN